MNFLFIILCEIAPGKKYNININITFNVKQKLSYAFISF